MPAANPPGDSTHMNTHKFPRRSRLFLGTAAAAVFIMGSLCVSPALARTKLVALPERASMAVNLQHPSEVLVTEERILPMQRGLNRIDFSWQNVAINPTSIQIEMLSNPDTSLILNVTYPPNENALVWEISAARTAEERVRISYTLGNIVTGVQYRVVASADERTARLQAEFLVGNQSGEDLTEARLVSNWPAQVQRTIANGETLRLTSLNVSDIPIRKTYTVDPSIQSPDAENKFRARMSYEIENTEDFRLGQALLPAGKYRIFQADPQGSSIFVGEDNGGIVPVGEELRLFLGMANDIVVRRVTLNTERRNIRRNNNQRIVAYDEIVTMQYEVDNFKDEAVELRIRERISDAWEFTRLTGPGSPRHDRRSAEELDLILPLPAKAEKLMFQLVYTRRNQLQ